MYIYNMFRSHIYPLLLKNFLPPQQSRADKHPLPSYCYMYICMCECVKKKQLLCLFEIGMIHKLCTSASPETRPCLMHKELFGVCGQSPKERIKPCSAYLFLMHNAYTALVKYKKQVVGFRKGVLAQLQTECKFYSPGMQTCPLRQAMSLAHFTLQVD